MFVEVRDKDCESYFINLERVRMVLPYEPNEEGIRPVDILNDFDGGAAVELELTEAQWETLYSQMMAYNARPIHSLHGSGLR